ncbi:MAG: SDR family oxidoreductase, partial [Bdellovibrionales bacterium]|nr:SDR family oxidoreductase [Bdellovibrionales bacterium]
MSFQGKTVFVTGSTRGIGKGIAEKFHALGGRVIINSRSDWSPSKPFFEDTLFFRADLSKDSSVESLRRFSDEKIDRLDVLVLNVGSGRSVPPGEETPEEWRRVIDINLFSATNTLCALKDKILSSRTSIVFVSSICGLKALGAPITYSAAKAAINSLVAGYALAWGKYGVRVNGVAPGNILFEGSVWDKKLKEDNAGVKKMLKAKVPLKTLGKVEDVADAVEYLASERSG